MKELIVLSALPGSGKSTWAEEFRLTHKHVKIVSSDGIRKEITGQYQDLNHEAEVWKIYESRIHDLLNKNDDIIVIADSTNITNNFRLNYLQKGYNFDKITLVVLKKKLPFILKANNERNEAKFVPEYAIKSMWDCWEDINDEIREKFSEVIEINKWFETPNVKESFHYKY